MVRFQLIWKSSYAKKKLLMCSVTQHQWKCRQMCGKCSQIHPVHSLFVCYKKWLVFTEESIHFNVSTYYRMSSYANNNLLMCSVIQNQCRRRQMCGNFHKFTKYTHFLSVTKMTCLDWTIYSWKDFNSFGSPLMLRTNYSCVQSLNISVDVAKWVENFRKFTQYTDVTFCLLQKITCLDWTIYSWQGFNSLEVLLC